MKKITPIRIDEKILEKLAIESTRQRILTGENLTKADLIRFYIEQGLKSKPKIQK